MEQVTRQRQGEKGASPGTPHLQIRSIKHGYKVMPEFPACANNEDFFFFLRTTTGKSALRRDVK